MNNDTLAALDVAQAHLRQAIHSLNSHTAAIPDYYPLMGRLVQLIGTMQALLHRIPHFTKFDPGDYYDHDMTTGRTDEAGRAIERIELELQATNTALNTTLAALNTAWCVLGRIGRHLPDE